MYHVLAQLCFGHLWLIGGTHKSHQLCCSPFGWCWWDVFSCWAENVLALCCVVVTTGHKSLYTGYKVFLAAQIVYMAELSEE